jgi:hypothetical protein
LLAAALRGPARSAVRQERLVQGAARGRGSNRPQFSDHRSADSAVWSGKRAGTLAMPGLLRGPLQRCSQVARQSTFPFLLGHQQIPWPVAALCFQDCRSLNWLSVMMLEAAVRSPSDRWARSAAAAAPPQAWGPQNWRHGWLFHGSRRQLAPIAWKPMNHRGHGQQRAAPRATNPHELQGSVRSAAAARAAVAATVTETVTETATKTATAAVTGTATGSLGARI